MHVAQVLPEESEFAYDVWLLFRSWDWKHYEDSHSTTMSVDGSRIS